MRLRRSRAVTGMVAAGSLAGVGVFAALAAQPHHSLDYRLDGLTTSSGIRAPRRDGDLHHQSRLRLRIDRNHRHDLVCRRVIDEFVVDHQRHPAVADDEPDGQFVHLEPRHLGGVLAMPPRRDLAASSPGPALDRSLGQVPPRAEPPR